MLDLNNISTLKKPVVAEPTGMLNAVSVTAKNVAHATAEWSKVLVKAGTITHATLDMLHTEVILANMDSNIELANKLAQLSQVQTNA